MSAITCNFNENSNDGIFAVFQKDHCILPKKSKMPNFDL